MMTDLDHIRQIELELGVELQQVAEIGYSTKGYVLNEQNQVIGLGLYECGMKRLQHIIKAISSLVSLLELSLDSNQISYLEPLRSLRSLQTLHLNHNQIRDLEPLSSLMSLQELWLDGNKISDLEPLSSLVCLQKLSLVGNRIGYLVPLSSLVSLQNLWLIGNQISYLEPLGSLVSLHELWLNNNQISDLEPLRYLVSLQKLSLEWNQIGDLEPLSQLVSLHELRLHHNQIGDIEPLMALNMLNSLSVTGNPIKILLQSITNLPMEIQWKDRSYGESGFITFFDNPLESPPPEIVAQGKEAVKNYFSSLEKAASEGKELVRLQEVKVHLVGEGLAGKTSLLKQLQGLPFSVHESQTHGINVLSLTASQIQGLEAEGELCDCSFHFWDFGGQEIMHASHQFFMTNRSIYILVLDSRTDNKTHYWLRHIEKYGADSPIIVVMNKIDENSSYNVQQKQINDRFPAIGNRFYRVSCKTGEGIDGVVQSLKKAVTGEHSIYGTPLSPDWIAVKEKLVEETQQQRYIGRDRYEALCQECGVTDQGSRKTLLGYLNSLGVVLFFEKINFADIYVLNPHWVTVGVYRVINSSKTKGGILSVSDLDYILNEEKIKSEEYDPASENSFVYKRDEQRYLLDIMEQFELCYEVQSGGFIIPSNLPRELASEPELDEGTPLRFVMKYDYLPSAIISRLMIAMQGEIFDGLQWRYGVVVKSRNHDHVMAKVVADPEEKSVRIVVQGEARSMREYFSVIRHHISTIHASYSNMEVRESIPLPGCPLELVEYKELLGYEKAGRDIYFSGKIGKEFSVSEMLDSVISKEERTKEQQMPDINFNVKLENIGNPTQHVEQKNEQQVAVSVNQELHQAVQNLQGLFSNLRQDMLEEAELEVKDENERKRLQRDLLNAEGAFTEMEHAIAAGQKALNPSVKERLGDFIENLADEHSRLSKGIKLLTKGAEKARKLAGYYNTCAPFFGLPSVPPVLLGK